MNEAKVMKDRDFQDKDWYDVPLYYDIIYDEDTQQEADFLQAVAAEYCQTDSALSSSPLVWLEPACGSGRLMIELQSRGQSIIGFDLNQHMLDFAAEAGSKAIDKGVMTDPLSLFKGSMDSFELPPAFAGQVDMGFCLVSTFKYLLTEEQALSHLKCMARHLKPGGCYALGFHLTLYNFLEEDLEEYEHTRDGIHVSCSVKGYKPKPDIRQETVRSRLVVTDLSKKEKQKCIETTWQFRTYSKEEFLGLLAKVPDLEMVATYDFTYDIESPLEFGEKQLDQVVILRKRG